MKQTMSCEQLWQAAGIGCLLVVLFAVSPQTSAAPANPPATVVGGPTGLIWDAEFKDYTTKPGERYAQFSFRFTNGSAKEIVIQGAKSSCFCTVAKLPREPWSIAPGQGGSIDVTVDLLGKGGTVSKAVVVDSTADRKTLLVQVHVTPQIPAENVAGALTSDLENEERLRNREMALADRQVIFKRQECASCHATPAGDKTDGAQIYAAACANCHDSPRRASVVPDLRSLPQPVSAEHWRNWIARGRAGSMMPAFARAEGGPLDDRQIDALVDYLANKNQSRPDTRFDTKTYAETMSAFPLPSTKP